MCISKAIIAFLEYHYLLKALLGRDRRRGVTVIILRTRSEIALGNSRALQPPLLRVIGPLRLLDPRVDAVVPHEVDDDDKGGG